MYIYLSTPAGTVPLCRGKQKTHHHVNCLFIFYNIFFYEQQMK